MPRRNRPELPLDRSFRLLLYRLRDPEAIHNNPLITGWIQSLRVLGQPIEDERAAAEQVRRFVESAIQELAADDGTSVPVHLKRQRDILVRCDLQGESHKKVAASIGISLRQFYRERQMARARIQRAVLAQLDRSRHRVIVAPDAYEVSLTGARMLYEMGATINSIEQLRTLASSGNCRRRRAIANATLIDVLARSGNAIAAAALLQQARNEASPREEALLSIVEISTSYYGGRESDANRHFDDIEACLYMLLQSNFREEREFAIRHLILATEYFGMNDAERTHKLLNRAHLALKSFGPVSEDIRGGFIARRATFQLSQAKPWDAWHELGKALSMSSSQGLAEQHAMSLVMLSFLEERRGRLGEAREAAAQSIQLLPRVSTAHVKSAIQLRAATVEVRGGRPKAGIALARTVGRNLPRSSSHRVHAALIEAEGLFKTQQSDKAISLCDLAYSSAMADGCMCRLAGLAMDLMSLCHLERGRVGEASACIHEAVDLLGRSGYGSSLARAQATFEMIASRMAHQ